MLTISIAKNQPTFRSGCLTNDNFISCQAITITMAHRQENNFDSVSRNQQQQQRTFAPASNVPAGLPQGPPLTLHQSDMVSPLANLESRLLAQGMMAARLRAAHQQAQEMQHRQLLLRQTCLQQPKYNHRLDVNQSPMQSLSPGIQNLGLLRSVNSFARASPLTQQPHSFISPRSPPIMMRQQQHGMDLSLLPSVPFADAPKPPPARCASGDSTAFSVTPSPSEPKGQVRLYLDEIQEWDVLCGRGGRSNHHPGNKRYRHVVSEMKLMYRGTEAKNLKTDLSKAIVEHVCLYGGRFIKKDESVGRYYVLTKAEARKKTSQALRETKELKWTF
jgi:hypothetical protein